MHQRTATTADARITGCEAKHKACTGGSQARTQDAMCWNGVALMAAPSPCRPRDWPRLGERKRGRSRRSEELVHAALATMPTNVKLCDRTTKACTFLCMTLRCLLVAGHPFVNREWMTQPLVRPPETDLSRRRLPHLPPLTHMCTCG